MTSRAATVARPPVLGRPVRSRATFVHTVGWRALRRAIFDVMRLADSFAERSTRGALTRMVGAWLCVGLPVIAARLWWSVAAAIVIFSVTVTAYVAAATRFKRRHRRRA